MAMGDELGSAVVHMSTKAVETSFHLISEILKMLYSAQEHRRRMEINSGSDITELNPGEVSLKKLIKNSRQTGGSISTSENGLSEKDAAFIKSKAKEYGIPVALTGNGDSYHVHCRSTDIAMLKHMMTDLMHDKLRSGNQDVGNFKVNAWEIPYITSELNKYNLNATFGKTIIDGNNTCFCMYDKSDEKAILIARAEYIRKYNAAKNDIIMDCDEEGFYTLKDVKTGIEISFDDRKISCNELSERLQQEFNYDKNKSDIIAARFGEEMLEGENKKDYFSNPQNDTKSILYNITFKSDDIYAKNYTCMRVVPKDDSLQRIAFVAPDGRFAVLNPNMTRKEMQESLKTYLDITDEKETDSLINKAEKAMIYYAKREDTERYNAEYKFSKNDFDMKDINVVSGMKREADNHVYTRSIPIDQLNIDIQRNDKLSFTVKVDAVHIEKDENQEISTFIDKKTNDYSFADKKKAVHELQQRLSDMGVPDSISSRVAHEVFVKAESQETEQPVYIEKISSENVEYYRDDLKTEVEVYTRGKSSVIDITNPEKGKEDIQKTFSISEEKASQIFGQAEKKATEKQKDILEKKGFHPDDWTIGEASYVIEQIAENNWKVPPELSPSTFKIEDIRKEYSDIGAKVSVPQIDLDIEEMSIGGR